jgi:hypothetical protein
MRAFVLLLALTAAGRADEPAFLKAAHEREAKATAFETTLSVTIEWEQYQLSHPTKQRTDLSGTGTVKVLVDGNRWWRKDDLPEATPGGMSRGHRESACDGEKFYTRWSHMKVLGPQAGTFDYSNLLSDQGSPDPLDELHLLKWVLRGTARDSLLAKPWGGELDGQCVPLGQERIGDHLCDVVDTLHASGAGVIKRRSKLWLDPACGYVPRRVVQGHEMTDIDYHPHPVCGWVPTKWVTVFQKPGSPERTTKTYTVESFELRKDVPVERFRVNYSVGARVEVADHRDRYRTMTVGEGGELVQLDPPSRKWKPIPFALVWLMVGSLLALIGVAVLAYLRGKRRSEEPAPENSAP